MVYLFEYDFRVIAGKSEDRSVLENYLLATDQDMAYAIISSEKEMRQKLSLLELQDYYDDHRGNAKPKKFPCAVDAVKVCWAMVVAADADYPVITVPDGSALKPRKPAPAPTQAPAPKTPKASSKPATKRRRGNKEPLEGKVFVPGDTPATKGQFTELQAFVAVGASYEDCCASFKRPEKGEEYMRWAIKNGWIKEEG